MRALALLPLVLFLSVAARADEIDDKWRAFLSDTSQERLSDEAQTAKLNWFVEQKYGPALMKAAEAIPETAGETEQQRKGQLAREALAWARPREDALGDLVLSRAYRQGLGVEANLFESLRLLRRPYQAQIPEALETLIVALDQGTGLPQNTPGAMNAAARFLPAFRRADTAPIALPYQLLLKPIEELRALGAPEYLDQKNTGWIQKKNLRDLFDRIRLIDNGASPAFTGFQDFYFDFLILRKNPDKINFNLGSYSEDFNFIMVFSSTSLCMKSTGKLKEFIFSNKTENPFRTQNIKSYINCSLSGKIAAAPPSSGLSLLEKYKETLKESYFEMAAGVARFGYGRKANARDALNLINKAVTARTTDATPKVLRGLILDEEGPLLNRPQARLDLAEGGKACLNDFFTIQKEFESDAQHQRAAWITAFKANVNFSFKTRWSPLTGLISTDGGRAMAECAQTALLRAAELGSAEAAYAITRLPDDAPGIVPLSNEKRQALLEQAVDGDIADAYADLANLYQNRVVIYAIATPRDGQAYPTQEVLCSGWQVIESCLPRPIRPLLEKGVMHNSPTAQAMLGARLVKGSPDDVERGWRLLQQAAETRDPLLLYVFAYEGLSRRAPASLQSAALDALTAAADMNYSPAQYDLAKLELARDQTPGEQRRSLMRLYAAAQAGHSEARKALADAFDKGIGLGAPSAWLGTLWRKGELP